jgi:hypothetical protein
MPLNLILKEFRNNLFHQDLLNKLFDFIMDPGILRNIIIVLLRDFFYCLKNCIQTDF